MKTEMGKIANLLDNIEEDKSPLRERLDSLGKILVVMCIVVCLIVTILGIIRGNDITEMFLLGVLDWFQSSCFSIGIIVLVRHVFCFRIANIENRSRKNKHLSIFLFSDIFFH